MKALEASTENAPGGTLYVWSACKKEEEGRMVDRLGVEDMHIDGMMRSNEVGEEIATSNTFVVAASRVNLCKAA